MPARRLVSEIQTRRNSISQPASETDAFGKPTLAQRNAPRSVIPGDEMLDLPWQKKAAEAGGRDPRQFPFGVLTGGSFVLDSSRVFLWFETLSDLADHLNETEPRARNLEPSDGLEEYQAEIAPLLARLPLEGLTEALREDLKPIIDDMFVIDWWGTFDDLRKGSGKVAEDVRSMFSGDDDASALPDDADLDEFVEFLLPALSEGRCSGLCAIIEHPGCGEVGRREARRPTRCYVPRRPDRSAAGGLWPRQQRWRRWHIGRGAVCGSVRPWRQRQQDSR